MKKILCILFCLLPVLGGKAQTLYRDQVRIEKESITRNEDNNVLSIDMDIVMQENLKLSSNHVVTLTPVPRIKWPHQDTTFHRSLRSQT